MSLEKRVSELESRLSPHPGVVAVVYRPEPLGEDAPTTLTTDELALYRSLLGEALGAAPDAAGYTLYLDHERPHWEVWGSEES